MKTFTWDSARLRALRPRDVVAYLEERGWEKVADKPDVSSTWILRASEGQEVDVLVPASSDLRDFALRMTEVLRALQRVEGRTQEDIFQTLLSRSEDSVRVRVASAATEDGTLPLVRGAVILPRLEELFGAAASSTIQQRPIHRKKSLKAREFLRHARLGQTQRGSYVVTVVSRLMPGPTLFDDPFERRVLTTLASALGAVRDAIEAPDRTAAFRSSVGSGVSANLCTALQSLVSPEGQERVEISFSWAAARPVRNLASSFAFHPGDVPVLEAAARVLGAAPKRDGYTLRGWVKQLRHEDPNIWNFPGSVVIEALIDDQPRSVALTLAPEDHLKAVKAYELGAPVMCVGDLVQTGKHYHLENPRLFTMYAGPATE